MPIYVDPLTLDTLLVPRRIGAEDYEVMLGELLLGRIVRKAAAEQRQVWFWSITGPYLPPDMQPGDGEAGSFDKAKVALRAKFMTWLMWAEGQGREMVWHDN